MLRIAAAAPLLLLAACDAEVKSPVDRGETVQMKADADGRVAFNLPFARGEVKLPAGIMSNADFDIDGVKMMPGAKITGFNLDAGKDRPGKVNIAFSAPASPQEVTNYFMEQFKAKGIEASVNGDLLEGTNDSGDRFSMRFSPEGSGTHGSIEINSNK